MGKKSRSRSHKAQPEKSQPARPVQGNPPTPKSEVPPETEQLLLTTINGQGTPSNEASAPASPPPPAADPSEQAIPGALATSEPPGQDPNRAIRRAAVGDIIGGRFRLEGLLGKGTLGLVLEARDEAHQSKCALKLLSAALTSDTIAGPATRNAVLRAKELQHPHIARVIDWIDDAEPGFSAIAMEPVDGVDLHTLRVARPHGWFEVADLEHWLSQICDALAYAHDRGVIHGDMKPANIMIDSRGNAKIVDFGIPALVDVDPLYFTGRDTSGTATYQSPAQMQGGTPAPADDSYALGVTLHELLTGKPPFFATSLDYLLHKITTQEPPSVVGHRRQIADIEAPIPAAWEETIAALLSRDPAQRPGVRDVMKRLFPDVAAAENVAAPAVEESAPGVATVTLSKDFPPVPAPVPAPPVEPPIEPALISETESPIVSTAQRARLPSLTASEEGPAQFSWGWGIVLLAAVLSVVFLGIWLGRDSSEIPKIRAAEPTPAVSPPTPPAAAAITPLPAIPAPAAKAPSIPTITPAPTPKPATPAPTPAPSTPPPPTPAPQAALPPFTNSLGMQFLPLPGAANVRMGIWPVRVRDYSVFAKAREVRSTGWSNPGFEQTPDHPVVNVSWDDAQAFCEWLTETERNKGVIAPMQSYRLPTDAEWSRGVGLTDEQGDTPERRDLGVPDVYPWGTQWPPPPGAGNYAGRETESETAIKDYEDGFLATSPVGSFPANPFGFYDMGGNVWQWVEDSWNTVSKNKVARGASWFNGTVRISLLSSCRVHTPPQDSRDNYGFRVVLEGEDPRKSAKRETAEATPAKQETKPAPPTRAPTPKSRGQGARKAK